MSHHDRFSSDMLDLNLCWVQNVIFILCVCVHVLCAFIYYADCQHVIKLTSFLEVHLVPVVLNLQLQLP